jgi:hypothetical protein
MGSYASYSTGAIAGLLVLVMLRLWTMRQARNLPPGPKPLPLIGNLLDLPQEKEWETYRAWNDRYGDVVCVDVLGRKIVILGSAAAVDDLMDKRGAIYSDRPMTPMMQLYVWMFTLPCVSCLLSRRMKLEWSFVVLPYGELWRRKRKLMHSHVQQSVAHRYHPVQMNSARRLVHDLLAGGTDNGALPRAIRLNFAQMVIKTVYGIDVDSYESEYVALPEQVNADFSEVAIPGRFLVDVLPIRMFFLYRSNHRLTRCLVRHLPAWLPGAGFKKMALRNHVTQRAALDNPIELVKSQLVRPL